MNSSDLTSILDVDQLLEQFMADPSKTTSKGLQQIQQVIKLLQLSDSQKKAILNGITTNIAYVDKELKIIWANKTSGVSVNMDPEEMIGKRCFELWGDGKNVCADCPTQKALINGKSEHTIIITPDGRVWDESGEPSFNEQNELIGAVEIARDITAEVMVQRELKEHKERFDHAIRATSDGLFDWNLVTNEIYYSPNWKGMLGYREDELPNEFSVWESLTEEEDRKKSWEMLTNHIEGKTDRFEMEFKMKHKEGHWVEILSRAYAIFDEQGKAIRVVGTHVDISKKNLLEYYFKKAQEIGKIGTWFLDIPRNLLSWTPQNYQNFGIAEGSPLNYEIFLDRVHPDDREYVDKEWKAALKGKPYEVEHRLLVNGKVKWVWQKAELTFDSEGNAIKAIGFTQDISKLKETTIELEEHKNHLEELVQERTKELEEKNKELERFNNLFVGREHRIIELKEKIRELEKRIET